MEKGQRVGSAGRYGLMLLTLVAAYLVSAVLAPSRWGGALHVAFLAGIGLLALRDAQLRHGFIRLAAAIAGVTAIAAGFGSASGDKAAEGLAAIWGGLLLLLTVLVIVNRVLRLVEVTAQSIYAALSAYLLIGLMFTEFFAAFNDLIPGSFFAHGQPANAQTLQYFSFTTLTTLGYGDFTAIGSLARAVATLEALIGQVFLATLVARLVSAYRGAGRRAPPSGE